MRTSLDSGDDVLIAAKELASSRKTTAGKVISEFARRGFRSASKEAGRVRNDFELVPTGGATVTVKLVDGLLDDDA